MNQEEVVEQTASFPPLPTLCHGISKNVPSCGTERSSCIPPLPKFSYANTSNGSWRKRLDPCPVFLPLTRASLGGARRYMGAIVANGITLLEKGQLYLPRFMLG